MKPILLPTLLWLGLLIVTGIPAETTPNEWQGKKVPQLILANGKTYQEVTFTKIEPDAITITHAGGIVRIPMESLRPESQQALGYDPEKAAVARQAYLAQQAALADANATRIAAEQAAMAAKANAAEQAAADQANAKTDMFIVVSVTEDGPLVNTYIPGGVAPLQSAISSITGSGGGGFVPPHRGEKVYLIRGYKGPALVDDAKFTISYVPTTDTYQYESAIGALITVSVLRAISEPTVKP